MASLLRACAAVVALTALGALPACAPAAKTEQAATIDLTGVWMNDNTLDERMKREGRTRQTEAELRGPGGAGPAAPPPLTPAYLEEYKRMRAAAAKVAEGAESCEWPGMPSIMTYPYPFEIINSPGRINFLFEAESQVRRIFLDRKEHLSEDDLDPSYNGNSIGHWEGSTLVIDTIGFNTNRPVRGYPHSDKMHIVERITVVDRDRLKNEITITDPEAFTKPIVINAEYARRPDWRIREYSCAENNRDAPDKSGERAGGVVQ